MHLCTSPCNPQLNSVSLFLLFIQAWKSLIPVFIKKNILIFGIEAYKLRFNGEAECLIKWIIKENNRKGIKENYVFFYYEMFITTSRNSENWKRPKLLNDWKKIPKLFDMFVLDDKSGKIYKMYTSYWIRRLQNVKERHQMMWNIK